MNFSRTYFPILLQIPRRDRFERFYSICCTSGNMTIKTTATVSHVIPFCKFLSFYILDGKGRSNQQRSTKGKNLKKALVFSYSRLTVTTVTSGEFQLYSPAEFSFSVAKVSITTIYANIYIFCSKIKYI